MKNFVTALGLLATTVATPVLAAEGPVPGAIPHLDHVFVIMMENHGYAQIMGNQNAPFINQYALSANLAKNYYAVAHPSLTNYLEITGGSNFGILSDSSPDWNDTACTPNLASGIVDNESVGSAVCPIKGVGTDAATPAIDFSNETSGPPGDLEIDGKQSIPAATNIVGKTIADQLVTAGLTWKSYQESIPLGSVNLVNTSDGEYTNLTNFASITPTLNPPLSQADIVAAYAVKHNPFAYFASTQSNPNTAGFETLYADLASGKVPNFSLVVPNQCNDQHGRGNAGPFCNFDPDDNGTQGGLNPALIQLGDIAVQKLVTAIHASPVWSRGHTAIVVVWDENDYFQAPETNQVVAIVDTNYGPHGNQTAEHYTHFSLLKSLDAGFRLPCLNYACDVGTKVMRDMFEQ